MLRLILLVLLCISGAAHAAVRYMAPGGSDNNSGLTAGSPWATINHAGLACGDVILAAAGTYPTASVTTSLTPSCSTHNVVAVICSTFDTCKVTGSQSQGAILVQHSYWGFMGWEASTPSGPSSSGYAACFAAEGPLDGVNTIHDIWFINDVANGCQGGGFSASHGVDYYAAVADIAYNGAQGGSNCTSGFSHYEPIASDQAKGTHIYYAQLFSWHNIDANPCAGTPPTDGEGVIFDTWSNLQGANGQPFSSPYTQQGVIENVIAVFNGSAGIELGGTGNTSAAQFIRHVTAYGNFTDTNQCSQITGQINSVGYPPYVPAAKNVKGTVAFNLAVPGKTTQNGSCPNPAYAFTFGNVSSDTLLYGNVGYSSAGNNVQLISSTSGFNIGPGNLFGVDPQLTNPVEPPAPNCAGKASVIDCAQSIITNYTPTNAAVLATKAGYQPPSSTPIFDPLFPQWLCNNPNIPSGLVTPGCLAAPVIPNTAGAGVSAVLPTAVIPTASPPAGAVTSGTTVALSSATPGSIIRYSTTSAATCVSAIYAVPIAVTSAVTLSAINCPASGYLPSPVLTAAYTITSGGPQLSGIGLGANPNFNGWLPFPGSAFYTNISALPVDTTHNTAFQTTYGNQYLHPDFISTGDTLPLNVFDSTSSTGLQQYPLQCDRTACDIQGGYSTQSADTLVTLYNGMTQEGGTDPLTNWSASGDHHMGILQRDTGQLWDTYNCKLISGVFTCGSNTMWDVTKAIEGQHPAGMTSADAAGLPVGLGIIPRYEEAAAGLIAHAMRMTFQNTSCAFYQQGCQGAYAAPASHAAGTNSTLPAPAFMGMRLRLKSTFDCSGFSAINQTLCTAMKTYGFMVADNGSSGYWQGVYDTRWNQTDLQAWAMVKLNNFEVVKTAEIHTAQLNPEANTGGTSVTTDQTGLDSSSTSGPVTTATPPTISGFGVVCSGGPITACPIGSTVKFTATATSGSTAYIDNAGPLRFDSTGVTITPQQTNTYTLTVHGPGGYVVSSPQTVTITGTQVATPTCTPAAGSYTSAQTVTCNDSTSGASMYYTQDGSTPNQYSTPYTASITVNSTRVIKVIAYKSGSILSGVATYAYAVNIPGAVPSVLGTSGAMGYSTGTTNSATYTFAGADTAILSLAWVNSSANPTGVLCDGSTAMTLIKSQVNTDSTGGVAMYSASLSGGGHTCTATWAASQTSQLFLSEISGTSGVDVSSSANTGTNPTIVCGSFTTTGTNRLLLATAFMDASFVTAGSGYTQTFTNNSIAGEQGSLASAGSANMTFTTNQSYKNACVAIALKP